MLLDGEDEPIGIFTWMRLKVLADPDVPGDSYIMINSTECELRIPSGEERGLQMIRGFTVGVGTTTDFTVDFNLRHSVLKPPGLTTEVRACDSQAYQLKPVPSRRRQPRGGHVYGHCELVIHDRGSMRAVAVGRLPGQRVTLWPGHGHGTRYAGRRRPGVGRYER